ncbi:hypothetical protein LAZ67_16001029 [Cordylochernes scorpioides]|uniref:Peptidase aspartic putative domain-containing protein n=1 Tax=Cordylochernes scorpioides TaxID=51811 RepID=A0ABY6LDL8_9ARAC|nr:hypothetical protein LAZ67_16001029 [Cordylochernes scorpioides]
MESILDGSFQQPLQVGGLGNERFLSRDRVAQDDQRLGHPAYFQRRICPMLSYTTPELAAFIEVESQLGGHADLLEMHEHEIKLSVVFDEDYDVIRREDHASAGQDPLDAALPKSNSDTEEKGAETAALATPFESGNRHNVGAVAVEEGCFVIQGYDIGLPQKVDVLLILLYRRAELNSLAKSGDAAREIFLNRVLLVSPFRDISAVAKYYQQIKEYDENIENELVNAEDCDDQAIMKELESTANYAKMYSHIQIRINMILEVKAEEKKAISKAGSEGSRRANLKLLKVELPCYDGGLENWISWWSRFKMIHEDRDLNNDEKMYYLVQAMIPGSWAHRLLGVYTHAGENYESAIRALNMESCLPTPLLQVWQRTPEAGYGRDDEQDVEQGKGDRLKALMSFLPAEVKAQRRINFSRIGVDENNPKPNFPSRPLHFNKNGPTAAQLMSSYFKAGTWVRDLDNKGVTIIRRENVDTSEIDLLLGADNLSKIWTDQVVYLEAGLTAINTKIGWSIFGEISLKEGSASEYISPVFLTMSHKIKYLLKSEMLGVRDPVENISQREKDKDIKSHFIEKIIKRDDGHYSISLPWKEGCDGIPSNFNVAQKRLERCVNKLTTKRRLEDYSKIFTEWEQENIIQSIHDDNKAVGHYLTHRPVFKETKKTTLIRPVYDASCRTVKGMSLNDCLEAGPNLLEHIPNILIRFREKKMEFQRISVKLSR